jgi:DNA-binding NarL/FixJ family response regulator
MPAVAVVLPIQLSRAGETFSTNPSSRSSGKIVSSPRCQLRYPERALRAGAHGYLNKQDSGEKVIEAIRSVLRGEIYVSAEITRRLVGQGLGNPCESRSPIELLTDRELEVFRMIGSGQTSGAIAGSIFVSTHTIDTPRENIKRKLGLKNAAELSQQAVQFLLENS